MSTRVANPVMPWFGLSYAALCAALVFFGFSFTFFSEVLGQLRPVVLYLHVATAAAWVLLVVLQAALARARKLALHRRIGQFGFLLGVVAALSAYATAVMLRHDRVMLLDDPQKRAARIAFLAIPLNGVIAFSILLACAYGWRHRPAIHRRCMLLGVAVLTLPAVARIPVIGEAGLWSAAPTEILILALCAIDLWRDGRLHRVHWIAVPAIVGLQGVATWLFQARPDWWIRTASALIGV